MLHISIYKDKVDRQWKKVKDFLRSIHWNFTTQLEIISPAMPFPQHQNHISPGVTSNGAKQKLMRFPCKHSAFPDLKSPDPPLHSDLTIPPALCQPALMITAFKNLSQNSASSLSYVVLCMLSHVYYHSSTCIFSPLKYKMGV